MPENKYKVSMKEDIVFKTEDSLWQMMARGEKQWDARCHDMSDDRIYRLLWGHREGAVEELGRLPAWVPDETFVSFQNKKTGEILKFRFAGVEFTAWAPGWIFIILAGLVSEENSEGNWRQGR